MKFRAMVSGLFVVLAFVAGQAVAGPLADYVAKPDDSYQFTIERTEQAGNGTAYVVRLVSQTWKGLTWEHWLTIFKPAEVEHPENALLFIGGGNNDSQGPRLRSAEAQAIPLVAEKTKAVVALLEQVPSQPIFGGKYEDAIIAYTFEQFLRTDDPEWPLLLPMTKSAVRAMDAIQAVAKSEFDQDIGKFTVTGGSKRGWTTWLTAVVDPRVVSIAPMVIDVLNMGPQMAYQRQVYGAYSEQVRDYTERGLQDYMQSEAGQQLLQIVDPYEYRDRLTLPKLIVLGTNDEFWCVDSAKFYFDDLKGDSWLHYQPNAPHSLNINVVPVLIAKFKATLTGEKLPSVNWNRAEDGAFEVTWDDPAGKPMLWQAISPNRDFRKARWSGTPLESQSPARVTVTAPESGWRAYYVSVEFPLGDGMTYPLSTIMNVTPDTFPQH